MASMATLSINARRLGSALARINSLNEVNFQIANLILSGDRLCILYRAICAQIKYVYLDLNRKIKRLMIGARGSSGDQNVWLCGSIDSVCQGVGVDDRSFLCVAEIGRAHV